MFKSNINNLMQTSIMQLKWMVYCFQLKYATLHLVDRFHWDSENTNQANHYYITIITTTKRICFIISLSTNMALFSEFRSHPNHDKEKSGATQFNILSSKYLGQTVNILSAQKIIYLSKCINKNIEYYDANVFLTVDSYKKGIITCKKSA